MDPGEMLKRGFTRETEIRRDRFGRWFDGAGAITHEKLVRSLDGWIDRAPDGRLCLSNDINWAFVKIEGAPYLVRSVRLDDDGVHLLLSGGKEERLMPERLRFDLRDALWCDVRGGRVPARFDRNAVHTLSAVLDEDDKGLYFEIKGSKVRPPTVEFPMSTWAPSHGHVETDLTEQ